MELCISPVVNTLVLDIYKENPAKRPRCLFSTALYIFFKLKAISILPRYTQSTFTVVNKQHSIPVSFLYIKNSLMNRYLVFGITYQNRGSF